VSAGIDAVPIPEAHGGEGADALATVIAIKEAASVLLVLATPRVTQIHEGTNQIRRGMTALQVLGGRR
jgi:alkylation response protein AidB-like acyl-CoA dehydrogenase